MCREHPEASFRREEFLLGMECSVSMALAMARVCSHWTLRHPLHGRGAPWKSRTSHVRRLCVRGLSVQDEGDAVEALAMDLALKAGTMIKDKSVHALQVDTKESRFDLVTEVDKACEDFLRTQVQMRTEDRELLGLAPCFNTRSGGQGFGEANCVRLVQEKFPNHFYLGEETATEKELERLRSGLKDSEWTWIVHPIYGTLNFVAGMPLLVVSIGVALGQNMDLRVVYNPFNNELFYARRGQGAYLNDIPINVLPYDTELEDSSVSVGFPSKPERRLRMLEAIGKVTDVEEQYI